MLVVTVMLAINQNYLAGCLTTKLPHIDKFRLIIENDLFLCVYIIARKNFFKKFDYI